MTCDLPTYPAPITQTFFTAIRGNSVSLRTRDCDNAASLRSSYSEGRNSGLALGVVGPVEQVTLPSEAEEEKTSMGISSPDMVASDAEGRLRRRGGENTLARHER